MSGFFKGPTGTLWLSNGETYAFHDMLMLSGSALAATPRERELVLWLAMTDQEFRGVGGGGFDVREIPWERDDFEREREFLLRVIDGARNSRLGWDLLDYEPRVDWFTDYLGQFRQIVAGLTVDDLPPPDPDQDADRDLESVDFGRCPKHGVILVEALPETPWCVVCDRPVTQNAAPLPVAPGA
jgi:hypothetical protein